MKKQEIGENAGVVWRALHDRRLSWSELVKETNLNDVELAMAVGWLAREDKISFTDEGGIVYLETYHENYY